MRVRAKAVRPASAGPTHAPQPSPPVVAPAVAPGPSNAVAAYAANASPEATVQTALAGVANASAPLPHLDRIQAAFGAHDVRDVQTSTGGAAGSAAAAIGARAFAVGDRIAFRNDPDLRLAAHEAAHVVQQRAGVSLDDGVGHPDDAYEQHADAVADAVVEGKSVEELLGPVSTTEPADDDVQMACACGTCAACVQKYDENAAALAPTPGGLRVGALDPGAFKDWFDQVLPDVKAQDLFKLERTTVPKLLSRNLGADEQIHTTDNVNALSDAVNAFNSAHIDATLKQRSIEALFVDIATTVVTTMQQYTIDAKALARDIAAISSTYRRLAYLYSNDTIERQSVPAEADKVKWDFERRAQLFFDFAKDKYGKVTPGMARVQQGLAADLARLAAAEFATTKTGVKVLAPDRGAELLVYQFLAETPPRVDLIKELFRKVYDDLRGMPGPTQTLVYKTMDESFKEIVSDAIDNQLAQATTPDAIEGAKRQLAIEIGRFLARLAAANAIVVVGGFLDTMGKLGAKVPDDVRKQREEAARAASAPPPAPKPPALPPPAVPHCPINYTVTDVETYLDVLVGLKKRNKATEKSFDAAPVMCQFASGRDTPALLATTKTNLDSWKAAAQRVTWDLRTNYDAALVRDNTIRKHRAKLTKGKDKDVGDPPGLVHDMDLMTKFYSRLFNVADERKFDATELDDTYNDLAFNYFHGLRRHQDVLIKGLELLVATEDSKLDQFLKQRYANTHWLTYAFMRTTLLGEQVGGMAAETRIVRWPSIWQMLTGDSDHPTKEDAEGLLVQIEELGQILANVKEDKRGEWRVELEGKIQRLMETAIGRLRVKIGERDQLYPDEVFDAMKPDLGLKEAADIADAKAVVAALLGDVNAMRYATLYSQADEARLGGDLATAADRARRMKKLRDDLTLPVAEGEPEKLIEAIQGNSTALIGLWTMAETSWVQAAGAMTVESPGQVVRAANLLRLQFKKGAATIGEAYSMMQNGGWLLPYMTTQKERDFINEGSIKGMKDKLSSLGGELNLIYEAVALLESSMKSRALKFMIDAEKAKSEVKRKEAIEKLANVMGAKSPSHSKAVAQYIFSFLLDAPYQLQDAGEIASQDIEEAKAAGKRLEEVTAENKKDPKKQWTAAELQQQALWKAAVKKVADFKYADYAPGTSTHDMLEAVEEKHQKENIIKVFDAHKHPIHDKRKLTDDEERWWKQYKKYGSFSEKGLAEMKEWGEGVLTAFAIGLVTGGIGEFFAGAYELGYVGQTVLTTALFTEATRLHQDITTGQSPSTWFIEDLAVNLVMHGASMYGAARMSKALNMRGIDPRTFKFKVGMFAAEYIATSGVGLAHLYLGSMIKGHVVTQKEIREHLTSNFTFLIGMKGAHALVEAPALRFKAEEKSWSRPEIKAVDNAKFGEKYEALNKAIEELDANYKKSLPELLKPEKSPAERQALMEHMADILDAKAKLIEKSSIPEAEKVAADFRTGVKTLRADLARGAVLEGAGVKPLAGKDSAHLSYERGSANEAALEAMFKENSSWFKVHERADGSKVYSVLTGEGVLRYEPRDPGEPRTGASQKEAYAKTTRIAGEAVPGKAGKNADKLESGKDVASVVATSAARAGFIPKNIFNDSFDLVAPGVKCKVKFVVADKLTSRADHEAGPATYTLKMNAAGEWEATVTVRKSAPNDHVVRAVNHEVTEIAKVIERLEKAGTSQKGGRLAFKTPSTLARAMEREVSDYSKKDAKSGLSAHTLATFNADVKTLIDQSAELSKGPKPGEPSSVYNERRKNNENDVGAMINLLELPVEEGALKARLKELEAHGVNIKAIEALRQLWVTERTGFRFTPLDMQLLFTEFNKANPNTVPEATYSAFLEYYDRKVREKVDKAVGNAKRRKGATDQTVRDAAMKEARRGVGGTSVASLRGRWFEGITVDRFNTDPQKVSDHGMLYGIRSNNFPTYDVAGVKVGAVGAKGVVMPLDPQVRTETYKGKTVQLLFVLDGNRNEIARQHPDGTFTSKPGVEIWVASLKAKDNLSITEMRKATGTTTKPTGQSMIVTQNGKENLKVDIAEKKAAAAKAKAAGNMKDFQTLDKQRRELEHFEKNIEADDDLRNEHMDRAIRLLKDVGLDYDQVVKDATSTSKKKSP